MERREKSVMDRAIDEVSAEPWGWKDWLCLILIWIALLPVAKLTHFLCEGD